MSDISKSQQSTLRKQEQEKRDMLFKIVTTDDIEQIQLDIQKQIANKHKQMSPSPRNKSHKKLMSQ